ncbi:expressed unknown protein [Seminavis robusta]|uniref:Uncharacterized protein n=1 Tax=Seminavis robusta TaxID=568900 RepID=A0A9N8H6S7_9STRA|nr:expressed unknown protein [Seminavis robusta]|eukprot:Sro109_g054450.1 n/a (278) ;mRNA; r:23189-24313
MRLLRAITWQIQLPLLALGLLVLIVPLSVESFLIPRPHAPTPIPINGQECHFVRQLQTCNQVQSALYQQIQRNDNGDENPRRFQRVRTVLRRVRKRAIPVVGSLLVWWAVRVSPVDAVVKPATPTYSIRPGMSQTEAQDLSEGKADIKQFEGAGTTSLQQQQSQESAPKPSTPKKSIYGDLAEDEEDDFDLDEDDEYDFARRTMPTRADEAIAKRMQTSNQPSHFASYRKERNLMMYVKKPKGPPDAGGSGSGGFDPGHGEASDEDRDRLNNLFDKS